MRPAFKQQIVVAACATALIFEPCLAFARHGQKVEDDRLSLVSPYVGKTKVDQVRQYYVPVGNEQGFVIEKIGKNNSLLERVTTWGDKTQIEIDRDGTGYLHEWEAFSDHGHITMGSPGNGHFSTMKIQVLTGDKRVDMSFTRNQEGSFTLIAQKVSPIEPMFQTSTEQVGSGYSVTSGITDSSHAQEVRGDIGADTNKLDDAISSLNKDQSCSGKEYSDLKNGIAEVMRSDTEKPMYPSESKYMQCLHSASLDAVANKIDAQFYGTKLTSKGTGSASFSMTCQNCSSKNAAKKTATTPPSSSTAATDTTAAKSSTDTPPDLCSSATKNKKGAYTPSSKDGGTISIAKSSVNSGSSSHAKSKYSAKTGSKAQEDYAGTFFHEMLHKAGLKENQVAAVMNCCAPSDGKKADCSQTSAVASSLGSDSDISSAAAVKAAAATCATPGFGGSDPAAVAKCTTDFEASQQQALNSPAVLAACGSGGTSAGCASAKAQAEVIAVNQTFGPTSSDCRDPAACRVASSEMIMTVAPRSPQAQVAAATIKTNVDNYCKSGGTDCSALKAGEKTAQSAAAASSIASNKATSAAAAGGPQMKKATDYAAVNKGVTNALSAATQIAKAAATNPTPNQVPAATVANPTEPHPPFNLATANKDNAAASAASIQTAVANAATNAAKPKGESMAGKQTTTSRDPAAAIAAPIVVPTADGKPKAKGLSVAAQGVREKAKKGDAVARQKFVSQMTQLERDEMHEALGDDQVQNSLVSYVLGVVDDDGKKRDRNVSPSDWLIFSPQTQHLVYKEGEAQK